MIRSPAGRAHFRDKAEFDREMERIEVEVRYELIAPSRLDFDVLFARAGYIAVDGYFTEVDSGARFPLTHTKS